MSLVVLVCMGSMYKMLPEISGSMLCRVPLIFHFCLISVGRTFRSNYVMMVILDILLFLTLMEVSPEFEFNFENGFDSCLK